MAIEWSDVQEPNEHCSYHHVVFKSSLIGEIVIDWKGWKEYPSYDCYIGNFDYYGDGKPVIEVYESTLEDAKAEVERQYKKLLLNSLLEIGVDCSTIGELDNL